MNILIYMLKGRLFSDVSQTWNVANYNNFYPVLK